MNKQLQTIKDYTKGNELLEHSAEMLDLSIYAVPTYKKEINHALTEIMNKINDSSSTQDDINELIVQSYKMFINIARGRDDEMRKRILG